MRSLIALLLLLVTPAPTPAAAAKSYSAERFDSQVKVLRDGTLEVVETVVFRFEGGPFTYVFRDLRTQRTDGIEILHASMDGEQLSVGRGTGKVEIRHGSKVHVQWNFEPLSSSAHTFGLTYLVRGAVRRERGSDLLEWVALPTEHAYRVDSSKVVVELPVPLSTQPIVETSRVSESVVEPGGQRVEVLGSGIGKNGWIKTRLQFAEGSVLASLPAWQQREATARAFAPRWFTAAGILFAVGLVLLFSVFQRYDSPPHAAATSSSTDAPPDSLRPALAGAIASNGRVALEHAMATLFTLADRGVVTIVEDPRRWGHRHFTLHRHRSGAQPVAEERTLLDIIFREEEEVGLTQARSRVARRIREFRTAVQQELQTLGLLDKERMKVASQYQVVSVVLLVFALLLIVPAIALTGRYGGYPFLIPVAVGLVAAAGCIFYSVLTPLSNEGVRRSERWRRYQRFLKEVARERAPLSTQSPTVVLPFAITLGLAGVWSKYVKRHHDAIPVWFRTVAASGDGAGFSAFIASGGSAHGGGASAGASAAGGGGSGAG
jgi:hypothetical protein